MKPPLRKRKSRSYFKKLRRGEMLVKSESVSGQKRFEQSITASRICRAVRTTPDFLAVARLVGRTIGYTRKLNYHSLPQEGTKVENRVKIVFFDDILRKFTCVDQKGANGK